MKHGNTAVFAALLAAVSPFGALADKAKVIWPDCYCTDRGGQRIELGESICMYVDGRSFTAKCEMSQNNPMWREQDQNSCLSSRNQLPQSFDPSLDTGLVNAQI